jgi:hypothetical protein
MGYRSDIGGVFSVDAWRYEPETKEKQRLAIAKYKEMMGFIKLSKFYELMQHAEVDRNAIGWRSGEFYFYAQSWKWYPDYDVVSAWNELWESMQEVEGISGYFCRVGEEINDIEQEDFGDEPDFDAFQPYTGMNCDVLSEVFGKGDIDEETKEESETKKPSSESHAHATQA